MPEQLYTKIATSTGFAFGDPWPWEWRADKRYDYSTKGGLPDPLKLTKPQRIDLLVKAGALIAAEIDRLQRTRPDR